MKFALMGVETGIEIVVASALFGYVVRWYAVHCAVIGPLLQGDGIVALCNISV